MCLIVFAWQSHPEYKLVLAANRDEFHNRPSQPLHWWPDEPDVLAGRDLQAGGSWLATHRRGRFVTVTNYREQQTPGRKLSSRGELVTDFVSSNRSAADYADAITGNKYAGFNFLATDDDELWYVSNRGDKPTRLSAGVYGLANASIDTPWPKTVSSRTKLRALIESNTVNETTLMQVMADRTMSSVADVDAGHLPFELRRALTAPFIVSPDYGTRCSTTVLWSHTGKVSLSERRFDREGKLHGESRFSYSIDHA